MKRQLRVVKDDRRMKEVSVVIDATTTLSWDGGEIDVTVPEGADEETIRNEIMKHLMSKEAALDWDWSEPEIHEWEIADAEDEDAE